MNLLWLGDPRSFDVALVGGKAANLSRLARLYHRVPDKAKAPIRDGQMTDDEMKAVWMYLQSLPALPQGE